MDKTSLESAIRDDAERAISAIARNEAEELKGLDDAYAAALEDFKKRTQVRMDDRIRQESSKVENRASLDLKKLKLKRIEEFINRTVEEAVKGIRDNPHYKRFLLNAVTDAIGRIPAGAEVRLAGEDIAFKEEIRQALKAKGKSPDVAVVEDKTIKWGGCIIVDAAGGRIYDGTIERIYYRKSPAIRREVMRLLDEHYGNAG